MQKRVVNLLIGVLIVVLSCGVSTSNAQSRSALGVAKEFYEAGMEADFEKLATLGCKNAGPSTTYQDARKFDLTPLGFIQQVIREEDSGIDLENLKLVVVRVKGLGMIGFGAFYVFKSPKGYKVYISPKREFLYEYPPDKIDLMKIAVDFYISNKTNLDKTIDLVQAILKSKPNDPETNYSLGYLYGQKGWRQKAIAQYKRVIILDKNYAERNIPEQSLIATWQSLLTGPDALRYYAAEKLYERGDRRVVPILMEKWQEALFDTDGEEIKKLIGKRWSLTEQYNHAARMLVKIGGKQAVPLLIEILAQGTKFQYRESVSTIVDLLGELGDLRAVPLLIKALYYEKWATHQVEALAKIGDKRAVEPLKKLLGENLVKSHTFARSPSFVEEILKALSKITGENWADFCEGDGGARMFPHEILAAVNVYRSYYDERDEIKLEQVLDSNLSNYQELKYWIFERWTEEHPAYELKECNIKSKDQLELIIDLESEEYLDTAALFLKKINGQWKITNIREGLEKAPRIAKILPYGYDYSTKRAGRGNTYFWGVEFSGDIIPSVEWKPSYSVENNQLRLDINFPSIELFSEGLRHSRGIGYTVKLKNATFEDGSVTKNLILYKYEVLPGLELPRKITKTYKIIPLEPGIPKEKTPTVEAQMMQKAPKVEEKVQKTAKKEEAGIPRVTARVSNADDKAVMYVNGQEAINITWGTGPGGKSIGHRPGDSGWIDITPYLETGDNILRFWVWNEAIYGAVSGTFKVQVDDVLAISRNFEKQDSTAGVKYDETLTLSLPQPVLKTEKPKRIEQQIKTMEIRVPPVEKGVVVPIIIQKGQLVTISATGEVDIGRGPVGPDGEPGYLDYTMDSPYKHNVGGLEMWIGPDKNANRYFVGSYFSQRVEHSGDSITLRVIESIHGYRDGNNNGAFKVTIEGNK